MSVSQCSLHGVDLSVVRLDLIDPAGAGNKIFKLKYNFQQARAQGYQRLISFGGAYSNHIHALALMGQQQGLDTIGLIRGEEVKPLNPTLQDAVAAGMQLYFLSRQEYRQKNSSEYIERLKRQFPGCYWVPEGGSNLQGVRGCMDIAAFIDTRIKTIIVPCGTAATLAGVAAACPDRQVLGVSVLKNAHDLDVRVGDYLRDLLNAGYIDTIPQNWSIRHDFHCGGYAKVSSALAAFMQDFERQSGIPVEPVYSGKMFYAIYQLLKSGDIDRRKPIAAVHTGGLQGLRGMMPRLNQQLQQ